MKSEHGTLAEVPLYVDLDGTLVLQDTLHESILGVLRRRPWLLFWMLGWLWGGKAFFKEKVARLTQLELLVPVVHPGFVAWLKEQKQAGRPIYLATAAHQSVADHLAAQFGLFSGVLATGWDSERQRHRNLAGRHKLEAITEHLREHGHQRFAYAGNSRVDLEVWAQACEVIAVNASGSVQRQVEQRHPGALVFAGQKTTLRDLLKAIRITQWAKNGLLFAPLLAAHQWDPASWMLVMLAFLSFGVLASSTYLVNDMLDLPNDRQHHHKKHRPIASGKLPVAGAAGLCAGLFVLGLGLAAWLSLDFLLILLLYTAVTLAYSFRLKRLAVVDVLVLSGLYSLRLFAGALVVGITLSNWLLTISMFLFLGLALVKRCAELEEVVLSEETDVARGRGYHQDDLALLRAMGIASGFSTVLVLALYIESQSRGGLYAQPQWLWGAMPLMLFWLMRIWIKASRRELRGEDPLQFALHDRPSWLVLLGMLVLALLASSGVRP